MDICPSRHPHDSKLHILFKINATLRYLKRLWQFQIACNTQAFYTNNPPSSVVVVVAASVVVVGANGAEGSRNPTDFSARSGSERSFGISVVVGCGLSPLFCISVTGKLSMSGFSVTGIGDPKEIGDQTPLPEALSGVLCLFRCLLFAPYKGF